MTPPSPIDRFLATLAIVSRDGHHRQWSRDSLFAQVIDPAWVASLEHRPERAERLRAFNSP